MFGNSLYKAESYGLIYWSHGEGWIPTPLPSTRWIGNDKTGGGHYMNIEDLKLVLQNAPHFDFIMFDACFMQSVEVAYELRDCCDYYIGFLLRIQVQVLPMIECFHLYFRKVQR